MFNGTCSGGSRPEKQRAARLAVHYEPIDALRLDPRNPRLHGRKQVRQIASSIAVSEGALQKFFADMTQ